MKTQLVPLGINGYIPTYGRETMSFLVLTDEQAILLDAGTGISRLMEEGLRKKLTSYEHLDVLLSHYHLDHVIGLSYLPGVWERHVTVHAPGPPFVEATPDEALGRLLQPPLFPKALQDLPMEVKVDERRIL